MGWPKPGNCGSIPSKSKRFSFLQNIQTRSGTHSASYSPDTRGFSVRLKRPKREANHWPPSSAKVKNEWNYTSMLPHAFMVWTEKTLHTLPWCWNSPFNLSIANISRETEISHLCSRTTDSRLKLYIRPVDIDSSFISYVPFTEF
jgi:hypothetical protein